MKNVSIILISINLFVYSLAFAQEGKVIANIMVKDVPESNIVLIDKAAKKLFNVKIKDDKAEVTDEFVIMYGSSEGDKLIRGDNKTPEGVYYITTYQSGEKLIKQYGNYAKIYGAGSLPLNYPNPIDKINKKTGSGIWIHGTDPKTDKTATQGCVALKNEDFNLLIRDIGVKYPVIIAENLTYLSPNDYDNLSKVLLDRFNGFIKAWGGSDYNKFKDYVHKDYRTGNMNEMSYLSNKKNLMKLYPDRVVITGAMKVMMKDPSYVVFDTDQFYCAPNITTVGDKKYYFKASEDGSLKLISEEFTQKDVTPYINAMMMSFLEGWVAAWERKDIKEYMKYYGRNFENKPVGNFSAWENYKQKIFDATEKISVKVSDMEWKKINNGYSVSFKQDYSADNKADKGIKTLVLEGCPTDFAIISETWKPL